MDEELGTGSVQITLDDSDLTGAVNRLQDRLEDALNQAGRDGAARMTRAISRAVDALTPIRIRVEADLRAFGHSIDTLANFDPVQIAVVPDVDRDTFVQQVQNQILGAAVHINVVPNLDDFDDAIRRHNAPDIRVDVNADIDRSSLDAATASTGRLSGAVRGLAGSFASIGALGGVLNDIRNLSGIAAAAPAAITTFASAIGVLRLATNGLGEAFSTALTQSGEEFTKSLEDMTPAMAAAAKELNTLQPAFAKFQEGAQSAFLEPLTKALRDLDGVFTGLDGKVNKLAGAFGGIAAEAVKVGTSKSFIDSIGTSLDALTPIFTSLKGAIEPLGQAFAAMSTSVTEAFGPQIQEAVDGWVSSLQDINTDAVGERAVGWVDGALAVFRSLGEVVENVKGIFGGLFGAAETAGAESFTGVLGTLLGVLNEFVNSAPVQDFLVALFQAFDALMPVVAEVAGLVADVLGPALGALGEALLPVVDAIAGAILPILPTLTDAFMMVLDAVLPLADVIGSALVSVVEALAPLLPVIADAFMMVAEAVAPLVTQLIEGLIPVFDAIAPVVEQIVTAIAPLITQLVEALLPILPPLVEAFLAVVNALLPLIPLVGEIVVALAPLVELIISALAPILEFAANIVAWLSINVVVPIIQEVVDVLGGIITVVGDIISAVVDFVSNMDENFSEMWSAVTGWVSQLVSDITGFFTDLWATVTSSVSTGISNVVQWFAGLPGRARSAISSLVSQVGQVFTDAWNRARQAVTTGINNVVTFMRGLPGKARAALGNLGSLLYSAGRDLIQGMINGVKSMAGSIANAAKSVVSGAVDGAKSILGINSPSKLFDQFGRWVGEGFVNGMDKMGKSVAAAGRGIADSAISGFGNPSMTATYGAVQGVTNPFGSGSPAAFGLGAQAATQSFGQPQSAVTTAQPQRAGATIAPTFIINEVSSEATAQQILNRLAVLTAV